MPEQGNKKKKKEEKKTQYIIYGICVLVVILVGAIIYLFTTQNKANEKELAYTELIKEIGDGTVEKVEMTVGSTTVKVKLKNVEEEKTTIVPSTQAFIELIQEKVDSENSNIKLEQKPANVFLRISSGLFSILPTIILLSLVILMVKMQGLGDKGKVYDSETTKSKITFDDVAGLDEEKHIKTELYILRI